MERGIQLILIVRRPEEIPQGATHLLHVAAGKIRHQGPLDTLRANRQLRWFFVPAIPPRSAPLPAKPSSSEEDEVFSLHHVTVRYDRTVALRDISWTVRRGERWALVGHNGSGKSTLLSLLTGDNLQAYANDVRLFGQKRGQGESIWDIRKRIGWVSPELQWHTPGAETVTEVIASGLFDTIGLHRSLSTTHRKLIRVWIERFGLDHRAPFASLGAGEQRMALLARALIKTPELILLDEPCQGLDSRHRAAFHRALRVALKGHPCALVYITHHQDELPPLVDRVLELKEGRAVRPS